MVCKHTVILKRLLTKGLEKKLDINYERMLLTILTKSTDLEAEHHKTSVRLFSSHLTKLQDVQDMFATARDVMTNSSELFSHAFLHSEPQELTDEQKNVSITSVSTVNAVKRNYQNRGRIGTDGERVKRNRT